MSIATANPAANPATDRKTVSDRSSAENALGRKLVAPAVILMLLVTAWPMIQALYLSLFRYRLTTPDDKAFVGLGNYGTILTDSLFWKDTWNTVLIMVITVAVELVIGNGSKPLAAKQADDHLLYNKKTGQLFYDDDGKGMHDKVLIATFDKLPGRGLDHTDFLIV